MAQQEQDPPGFPGFPILSAVGPPPDCSPVEREACALGEAAPKKKVACVVGARLLLGEVFGGGEPRLGHLGPNLTDLGQVI